MLTVFAVAAALYYTPAGLHLVVWGMQKAVPGLSIGQAQGALGRTVTLHHVVYQNQNPLRLRLKTLSLSLDNRCLLQPAVCMKTLSISGVRLRLSEADQSSSATASPDASKASLFSLPVLLRVSRLTLNDVDVDLPQVHLQWQTFSSHFSFRGHQIRIGQTDWRTLKIALRQSAQSSAAKPSQVATGQQLSEKTVLPEIWIPVDVRLDGLNLSDLKLQQKTPRIISHLSLAGRAFRHRVDLSHLAISMPELDARGQGYLALRDNYPLNIHVASTLKLPEAKGQKVTVEASGSLAKLKLSSVLNGLAKGRVTARLALMEPTLPFQLELQDVSGQWPLTGQARYQIDLNQMSMAGSLNDYRFDADGRIRGTELPDTRLHLTGRGDLHQVVLSELHADTLNGKIAGQMQLSWQKKLSLNTELTLKHIEPQVQWPEVPGRLDGTFRMQAAVAGEHWSVDVSQLRMDGNLEQYPVHVSGQISASGEADLTTLRIHVPDLMISHGQNYIQAKGKLDRAWDMKIGVSLPDLSKSVPSLAGRVTGQIRLDGNMRQPEAILALSGRQIRWQQLIQAKRIELNGRVVPLPLSELAGNIRLRVQDGYFRQNPFQSVNLNTRGDLQHHQLTFSLKTPQASARMQLSGSLDQTLNQWQGELAQASLSVQHHVLRLAGPTTLSANIKQSQFSVGKHCWFERKASLCLTQPAIFNNQSGEVHIAAKQVDLAQLKMVLPEDTSLAGQLNGRVEFRWLSGQSPLAKIDLKVSAGHIKQMLSEPLDVRWQSIGLRANLDDNLLSASGEVDLLRNGQFNFQLRLPDVMQAPRKMAGVVALKHLDLSLFRPLIGEYSQLQGIADSQLTLGGTVMHPNIRGVLTIKAASLEGEITPVDIQNGQLTLGFDGYQARLQARADTLKGHLNLDGRANWVDMARWSIASDLHSDGVKIDVPPMVQLNVIPKLHLDASPKRIQIEGTVNLPQGNIEVDSLPSEAVRVSDDQVIITPSKSTNGMPTRQHSLPVETHIGVIFGDDVKLSAFGLKGELRGALNVSQRDNAPFVTGEVNIVNGTYRSFGQDLVIQQGKILMNGPVDKPYVAITAIRNPDNIEDDVTAGIRVTGEADTPSVTVFSDPTMPQANALSYLIRGRDLDAKSGNNTVMTSLIGLSLAKSSKIVGEIGQVFGVQDLQLDTSGSGDDSQVTVSGYILPDLQVKYGVGIFNSVGEFTLRYRLMKNLYVEAVSGLTNTVNLLYQFDFD
jgi:translocation and assembly module TamB